MAKRVKKQQVDIDKLKEAKKQREEAKEAVKPVTNYKTILRVV